MIDSVTFLGCAFSQLVVFFDMCYEKNGVKQFQIYKNISIEGEPKLQFNPHEYNYKIFEPGSSFNGLPGRIAFGVTGPWAKFKVSKYFLKKHNVKREDYMNMTGEGTYIASSSTLEKAIHIQQNVVVSSQTHLGFGVTIKRSVSIGHHNEIGDFAEINPGVTISGNVNVGRATIIGSGAVIMDGIQIGDNSMIGMGSVVTKDIPAGVVAYGNPCKIIRENEKQTIPLKED